jgi:mono/diheme cytochrome c family protein
MRKLWAMIGVMMLAPPLAASADESRLALATRWYTDGEVKQGRDLFQAHCAACHGDHAQGAPAWDAGASLPPPLNGSGHVAHHSLDQLLAKIEQGGLIGNSHMPPFRDVLTGPERRAALAYVQSLWPDAVYLDWQAGQDAAHYPH